MDKLKAEGIRKQAIEDLAAMCDELGLSLFTAGATKYGDTFVEFRLQFVEYSAGGLPRHVCTICGADPANLGNLPAG